MLLIATNTERSQMATIIQDDLKQLGMNVHVVALEPRAILAQWQGDKVTVWSSTQVPFAARAGVARFDPDAADVRSGRALGIQRID